MTRARRVSLAPDNSRAQFGRVPRMRRGLTLVELVMVIAILGVLGVVIVGKTTGTTATQRSDQERINEAGNILDQLSRAMAFFEATLPRFSFKQIVGVYPGRLSHLTAPISTSQRNSCGSFYTAGQVALWQSFYTREIPTAGFIVAPGFVTQDSLVRTPPNTATTQRAELAIVIPNVTFADAVLLDKTVDGDSSGTAATVRYSPVNGTSPVTVSYITMVGGC